MHSSCLMLFNAENRSWYHFKCSVLTVFAFAERLYLNILFMNDLQCETISQVPHNRVKT